MRWYRQASTRTGGVARQPPLRPCMINRLRNMCSKRSPLPYKHTPQRRSMQKVYRHLNGAPPSARMHACAVAKPWRSRGKGTNLGLPTLIEKAYS